VVGGKVVTRFPPEPSGFLHIGHAKASMLNHYFAHEKYDGKMILRFDDTNPSKEKEEFVDAIKKDIATLGITFDQLSHTSDHFELIQKHHEALIAKGLIFIDPTPQEVMKVERMDGLDSAARGNSVKENQRLWGEMKKGSEEGLKCCARMKMPDVDPAKTNDGSGKGMQNKNKCLRDPATYRCNTTPHQITGKKYKVRRLGRRRLGAARPPWCWRASRRAPSCWHSRLTLRPTLDRCWHASRRARRPRPIRSTRRTTSRAPSWTPWRA
jgi:glutamyl-tRNA synthetase